MNKQHVDDTLNVIRVFFEKASTQIEAIAPGEKIPATTLADDIAKEHGMTGAQLYPVLLFLFKDYPGVDLRKGAQGGIYKLKPGETKKPKAVKKVL
jgi:hypothetical protein